MATLREIAFINSDISDSEYFVAGLRSEVEPVVLDRSRPDWSNCEGTGSAQRTGSSPHRGPRRPRRGAPRFEPLTRQPSTAKARRSLRSAMRSAPREAFYGAVETSAAARAPIGGCLSEAAGVPRRRLARVIGAAPLGGRWELDGADPTQAPLPRRRQRYAGDLPARQGESDQVANDSGAAGDFVTNDNTLTFSGTGTATASSKLGVWLSGGSYGTGTMIGQVILGLRRRAGSSSTGPLWQTGPTRSR